MSQPLGYWTTWLPQPRKRKGPPLPPLPQPAWETLPTSRQLTSGTLDEQGTDPPTKQMSQLHIWDTTPPDSLRCRNIPGRQAQVTRNAPIPTCEQIKTLYHQARGMTSLQGSPNSPEKVFIAMLALLSCQVSASPISGKYWAYLPDPPTFQVVSWNNEPIRVNTDQPQLLGGFYTSYTKDKYPINFNHTFWGLIDDLPVCFNFPSNPKSFITPTKEGCIGASTKIIITYSSKIDSQSLHHWVVWVLVARLPGIRDPALYTPFRLSKVL